MTEPTRIIAIRHGQTDWNVQQRLQGLTDIALNAHGQAQAARLAEALRHEGLTQVISSDLGRAAHTAQALCTPLGLAVQLDPALRERAFGQMEGLSFRELDEQRPEWAARWRAREPDFEPPGGESLRAFHARSVEAVLRHASACPGQTIAVVSHGGVLDCLYRAATGLDLAAPRTWQLGNAVINRLLFNDQGFDGQGLTLIGWNDHQHLDELDRAAPVAR